MNVRAAIWLAWTLWALTVVLTALSLFLLVLNLGYPNTPIPNYWLGNVLVVIEATVGAIVASRQHEHLHLPVCRLRPARAERHAPSGRGVGLDSCLDTAGNHRPSDILPPVVPNRAAAEQALEVVSVADGGFRRGGADRLCVLFRSILWRSRTAP